MVPASSFPSSLDAFLRFLVSAEQIEDDRSGGREVLRAVGETGVPWPSTSIGAGVTLGDGHIVTAGPVIAFLAGEGGLSPDLTYGMRLSLRIAFYMRMISFEPTYEHWWFESGDEVDSFHMIFAFDLGGIFQMAERSRWF